MKTYYGYSIDEMKQIVEKLETITTDQQSVCEEYCETTVSCSGYTALRLDPTECKLWVDVDFSRTCSEDEGFKQTGVLSVVTLADHKYDGYSPDPEDGFELEAADDGQYWFNDIEYFSAEDIVREMKKRPELWAKVPNEYAGEILATVLRDAGYYRCNCSCAKFDGWPCEAETIDEKLHMVIENINEQIAIMEGAARAMSC